MGLSPAQIKVMGGPGCINEGGVIPFMNVFFNRRKENEKSRNNNLFDRGSSSVDQTTDIRDREGRLIGTQTL